MIEGLVSQMPQTTDAFFSTEITNHLFQKNDRQENFGLGKKIFLKGLVARNAFELKLKKLYIFS